MAYQQKYYKELVSQGHKWRLEIYQDTDESIQAVEIGPVLQGLKLIMQGDQADIDTPIVKTSLEMVFVDAPDLETERKCGYWEEFYTSSATEYKVSLLKNSVVEWTGYITPDSFSESLQYRGSVTIIARDNLGAMQDFEYDFVPDESGMVSLLEIYTSALDKASFPMKTSLGYQFARSADIVSADAYSILFNSNAFKDKTWLDALESVLSATGLVLRYVGGNTFKLLSIREIPLCGKQYWWDVPVLDVVFCAYGQRELSPAAKTIIDEVTFDIEEDFAEIEMPESAYGQESTFTFYRLMAQSGAISNPNETIPVHAIVGGSMRPRSASLSLAFNALKYPLKEGHSARKLGEIHDPSRVYIAANGGVNTADDNRDVEYRLEVGPGTYDIGFTFGAPIALYDQMTKVGHIDADVEISQLKVLLNYRSLDSSIQLRYDVEANAWVSGVATRSNTGYIFPNVAFPYTISFAPLVAEEKGYISITITRVSATQLDVKQPESKGMYVPLENVSIKDKSLETTSIPEKQKVTTKYNEKNNIILNRKPEFGFNSGDVASPRIIKNGMYIYKNSWYESAEEWKFNNDDAVSLLPVLIHQQLLAYYSKPNNVLTGELATDSPAFNALYEWNGKNHLLTSGALNIITGRMENVVLREFSRYDHMWETWPKMDIYKILPISSQLSIVINSKKTLTASDLSGVPAWMSLRTVLRNAFNFNITANNTGSTRSAIIKIDTAYVKVTQSSSH